MSKIKHTKNELKTQRESLRRFERFLPMLQLKKQQLQMEIQSITNRMLELEHQEQTLRMAMKPWIPLFSEQVPFDQWVSIEKVQIEEGNIAGVAIPVLREINVQRAVYDLFLTPPWVDDAVDAIEQLIRFTIQRSVFAEQRRRIEEELRTTSQRVNLFEKVKIPECREHIRIIRIFLGDEQTAAVARGKLAKRRTQVAA